MPVNWGLYRAGIYHQCADQHDLRGSPLPPSKASASGYRSDLEAMSKGG